MEVEGPEKEREQAEAEAWLKTEADAKKSCGTSKQGDGGTGCGDSWEAGNCAGSAELDAERLEGLARSFAGGSGDAPTYVDAKEEDRPADAVGVKARKRRSSQLLKDVADEMMGSRKIVLLCFDEFQLNDVVEQAAAIILLILFWCFSIFFLLKG